MADDLKQILDQLQAQEAIIAQLTLAYSEVWMVVEALVGSVLVERSEEERTEFWKNISEVRTKLYEEINKVGGSDVGPVNPDLAAAVEKLVTGE